LRLDQFDPGGSAFFAKPLRRAAVRHEGADLVDTRDANRAVQVKTPTYRWLVRNAEHFGFRPYFYEPWHWEYVK